MSTILQHSASAITTFEYKSKREYAEIKPKWIKEKQLLGYYNSMNRFYSECLDELTIPERFNKEKLHELLMNNLKKYLNENEDLRNLIIRLFENYPRFPIESDRASNYIALLRRISRLVALVGARINTEYAAESIRSDIPYIVFSNLILGNYAVSSFHDYKADATEQHFRHNYLLVRGRPNLKPKETALKNYFQMMKPTEEMFQKSLKAQFKLWLFITFSNAENLEELTKKPQYLNLNKIDQKQLTKLITEHEDIIEKFRRHLFQLEPDLFKHITEIDEPTQTMWRDMVLLKIKE